MQQIEGLLKQPRRDQAKSLARLSEQLRDEVLEALDLRNRLAHHFLMEYRMTRGVSNTAIAWASEVKAAITTFDELNRELDKHAQTQLADAGIAELSEEEEEQLIESLERWSEDVLSAGYTDSADSEEGDREAESS